MAGVARKYRRLRSQRDLRHEYRKLRRLLPQPDKARGKVAVVDAAHAYILQLQTALLDQLSSRRQQLSPKGLHGDVASVETVRSLAVRLIRSRASARSARRSSSQSRALSSGPTAPRSFSSPLERSSAHTSIRPATSEATTSSSSAASDALVSGAETPTNQKLEVASVKTSEEGEEEDACGLPSGAQPPPSSFVNAPSSSANSSTSSSTSHPVPVTSPANTSLQKSDSAMLKS